MLQISERECDKIVKRATRGEKSVRKIEKVTIEHFGNFLGYLGEYYRLKIIACMNDDGGMSEFQFFVKSLPIKDLRSRRSMLINSGIFLKEVQIYKEIFSVFSEIDGNRDFWRPLTYLLRDDLLVFDDLSLKNYKVLDDNQHDLSRKHIEAILKSFASFHACSIIFEKNEKISIDEKFHEILFETSIADIPWFHAGLEVIRQIALKTALISESESEDFYESLFSIIKVMESSPFDIPSVLCHRDTWKNNLMFSSDLPIHCVIIDFQTARYLPLSVDVCMAIFCNTQRDHYEKLADHYVNYYHSQLSNKLEEFDVDINTIMSEENFTKSCEHHKNLAIVYNCIIIMLTKAPQELFQGFNEQDFRDFAEGDRYRLVSKFMEKDSKYSELLTDAVTAVVELFYRNKEFNC